MKNQHQADLIFIPTYNECGNVENICTQILSLGLGADILFLDDNSPDGTGEILDRLASRHPGVFVIHRPGKLGIGGAHLDGISWAYAHGYRRLITMDCDFTHSPADIVKMLGAASGYDVAVGSRFLEKDSLPGWHPFRRLLTRGGHFLTRHLLKIPFDASGAFRVYDLTRIPREIFLLDIPRGYAFFFESLFILSRNGCSINQVPIILPSRTVGASKMTLREMFRGVSRLLVVSILSVIHPSRFTLPSRRKGSDTR
jgi:dolichol-phosphate mannosyltransferase